MNIHFWLKKNLCTFSSPDIALSISQKALKFSISKSSGTSKENVKSARDATVTFMIKTTNKKKYISENLNELFVMILQLFL